jgi:hypothetical protein
MDDDLMTDGTTVTVEYHKGRNTISVALREDDRFRPGSTMSGFYDMARGYCPDCDDAAYIAQVTSKQGHAVADGNGDNQIHYWCESCSIGWKVSR